MKHPKTIRLAGTPQLLTREEFKHQVLARRGGACVFCEKPAVDAHHILERKLFGDGGYFIENGAAVCDAHHWDCERTVLAVEAVRAAAGLKGPAVLPAGFDLAGTYDKWGNRIWPSGMRSWGPLETDTGARRALAQGGFLAVMMPAAYCE
jgi:hypothetical protein